jgi:ATP-dependent protease ClpP protease subunit
MPKSTTLRLVGEITDATASVLVEQINKVPAEERLTLRISSPGGAIFAGTSILTALRERTGGLDTVNESLAASMASAIFMLGENRTMAKGSRLMIHKPWSQTSGESNDLRQTADLLDSLEKTLLPFTASPDFPRTGLRNARGRDLDGRRRSEDSWLRNCDYGYDAKRDPR